MTIETLSQQISDTFGTHKGALKNCADALPVNYDNLRKMLSGNRPIPAWIWTRLSELAALKSITPPPDSLSPDADRDEPCGEALDPHIDDLVRRAITAGWLRAEAISALQGWIVYNLVSAAGLTETRDFLAQAIELAELQDAANATPS